MAQRDDVHTRLIAPKVPVPQTTATAQGSIFFETFQYELVDMRPPAMPKGSG